METKPILKAEINIKGVTNIGVMLRGAEWIRSDNNCNQFITTLDVNVGREFLVNVLYD